LASDLVTQRLTVDYDPKAEAPQWKAFLRQVLITPEGEPDEELIHWLQVLIGYGITGRASEQAFAVFFGKGANGKGVLIDVLTEIFAAITKTAAMSTFEVKQVNGPSSDQARLVGARLVFTSEGEVGARLSAANIKRFTGEDRVTARFMYATEFEFRPRFLLIMASNTKPHVIDSSEGYWRRVKLVPFRRFFEEHERDPHLRDKLLAEAPGILRWAVDGAREWYKKGLPASATVRRETLIYRDSSDRLAEFMATRLDITGNQKDRTKATDVVKAYKAWAEDAGEEVKNQLSRSSLLAALGERKGISTGSYAGQLHLYGVTVLGEADIRRREVAAEKAERSLKVVDAAGAAG
jgi:putative DNA primase/helicase